MLLETNNKEDFGTESSSNEERNNNMTVKELYEKVENGDIIREIELQRAIVYDDEKQSLVIDSFD